LTGEVEKLHGINSEFRTVLAKTWFRRVWYSVIILFFLLFVLTPSTFVLTYLISGWDKISANVLGDSQMISTISNGIITSFRLAGAVTIIDIIAGLPMAWLLNRGHLKGRRYLDTLIDLPLVVPTSALGFSVALFWATPGGFAFLFGSPTGAVTSSFILLMLLHVAFSYPYMVRALSASLEEIDITYEIAGRTLGASPLTAIRTITLPLFRGGVISGTILSFGRSISETGATALALSIVGASQAEGTATVLIAGWRKLINQGGAMAEKYTTASAFTSILLIILSLVLLTLVMIIVRKFKLPFRKVWPAQERILSGRTFKYLRDASSNIFLIMAVLIPAFFIFIFFFRGLAQGSSLAGINLAGFLNSLFASFLIASIVTVANIGLGIPMAILVARKKAGAFSKLLDVLINIPMIIPSTALGFSLALFWSGIGSGLPSFANADFLLIVLAHIAFTYPFIVRTVSSAIADIDISFEEAARTLGANPLQVFRKIIFPLAKPSIMAGAIMMFARSLGETGATLAVSPTAITTPVYIVTLVNNKALFEAALACIILIWISYIILLGLRHISSRK
jgi:thiamine transport system permease protein